MVNGYVLVHVQFLMICWMHHLQILREKKAAAELATNTAMAAARQLHTFVGELNAQHALMQRAAQAAAMQTAVAADVRSSGGRFLAVAELGSRVGSHQQLELLAHQQQQQQHMVKDEPEFAAEHSHQQQQQRRRPLQQSPEMSPGSDVAAATATGDAAAVAAGEGAAGAEGGSAAAPVADQHQVICREISLSPYDLDEKNDREGDPSTDPNTAADDDDHHLGRSAAEHHDLRRSDETQDCRIRSSTDQPDVLQEANEEDLEAAALLGSLHDLAALQGQKGAEADGTLAM